MESQNCKVKQLHPVAVVIVPLPAQGHLNQLLHLSHLIASYGIPVHYAGSTTHNRQAKLRLHGRDSQSLAKIHFHDFQLPPYHSPPPSIDISVPFPDHFTPLFEASNQLREPISQLLHQLSQKFSRVVVIHDHTMTYVVQDVKLIPNAKAFTFIPISAFTMFSNTWESIPEEAKPFKLDSNDIPENMPTNEGCATKEVLEFARKQIECLGFESGWIFNTCRAIEGKYVTLLDKLSSTNKSQIKHFAIGPFHPVNIENKNSENRHQCLKWLDEQEKGTVIYVSFGSTTSLPDDQIEELANGLEQSEVKFLWVLRRADPNDVFEEADRVKKAQLPEGYEDRVKDRGMIVKDWAPQLEILAHPSTGGFMSHCGWNSCMESMSMGVPVAAWPMHSDQPRNAVLLTEVLRIGILVRDWAHRGEVVKSSTIENVVKTLMASEEGKEMKKRAAELGESVRGSVAEGGVSCLERDSFIAHISK
ncbi:zeatin O-glucosyltransferase [Beta vulgaris subsp. vulgaris]|uniref:zeatin O-glucosyltransferase n=1 Tax=Beta vulgaris subsp. vulgaris TaxID=3555 RepID=UPI0020370D49|nr:zeatin O-glucosyltransferase [Beta vulgaris subsp. vulgaris]